MNNLFPYERFFVIIVLMNSRPVRTIIWLVVPAVALGFLVNGANVNGADNGFTKLPAAEITGAVVNDAVVKVAAPCDLAAVTTSSQIVRYRCSERLNSQTAQAYLNKQTGIKLVAPVRQYSLALIPNDLDYNFQKNYYDKIKAPAAWDVPQSQTIRSVIAVLDTGVDVSNPDLASNIWFNPWEVPNDKQDNDKNGYIDDLNGWDFVANVADPEPKFDAGWNEVAMNHGTIVAGVAAAIGNNVQGVAGLAWHARLMPIRVLDGRGLGDTVTVARGIQYAIANHADIINLSFVGQFSDPILEDAIQRAYQAGILVVAAAGNEQQMGVDMNKQPHYPVCSDGFNGENQVIGVAAVDDNDVRAEFSNFGSKCIDLAAPGVKIYSTQFVDKANNLFQDYYGGYWSGTSVAAPLVSGSLALLKSAYPNLSPSQLRDVLIAAGDLVDNANPGQVGQLGRRLNLQKAFALAGSKVFSRKTPIFLAPQTNATAEIALYDLSSELMQKFLAYDARYTKGINVAAGDVDGDGQIDVVTVPRAGGGPHVKIFNLKGGLESQFMALPEQFRGGLSVAVADFTADKKDEIVIGVGKGGSNLVRIYDEAGNILYQFIPYDPSYIGGVNVAVGDTDGDGQPEIVTAPAGNLRLPIRVFDKFGNKRSEFYAFSWAFPGGVNVAVGDTDGDGKAEIVVAPGAGGGPQVRVFNYQGRVLRQFFAFAKNFRGGVNVAVGDTDGNGSREIVATPGVGGGPQVRVFNGQNQVMSSFFIEPKNWRGGLTVGTAR